MTWSFGSNSPQRDTTVSVEEEMEAWRSQPEVLPWRHKLVRLRRFLTGHHARLRRHPQ